MIKNQKVNNENGSFCLLQSWKIQFHSDKEKEKVIQKKSNAFVCRENLAALTFHFADRIWNIKLHFGYFSVVFIVTITRVKFSLKKQNTAEHWEYEWKTLKKGTFWHFSVFFIILCMFRNDILSKKQNNWSYSQCSDPSKIKKCAFSTKFWQRSFHYKYKFFVQLLLNLTSYIKCNVLFLHKLYNFFVVKSISISCINFRFSNKFSFGDRLST